MPKIIKTFELAESTLNRHQLNPHTVILTTASLSNMSYGLPSDDELVAAAAQHKQDMRRVSFWKNESGFPFPRDGQPVVWVKYSKAHKCLEREAITQDYVYQTLKKQPGVSELIRVPQIYRFIQDDEIDYSLIVMEYVRGKTVRQWLQEEPSEERKHILWNRVLYALETFLKFQPPEPLPPPGPVGGGRIAHLVFGQWAEPGDAPIEFDSLQALQEYVNQTTVSFELYIGICSN